MSYTPLNASLMNSHTARSIFFFSVYTPTGGYHVLRTKRAIVTLDLSNPASAKLSSRGTENRENKVSIETTLVALALTASPFRHLLEGYQQPTETIEVPDEHSNDDDDDGAPGVTPLDYLSDEAEDQELDPNLKWKAKFVYENHRYPQRAVAMHASSDVSQYYRRHLTSCFSCDWDETQQIPPGDECETCAQSDKWRYPGTEASPFQCARETCVCGETLKVPRYVIMLLCPFTVLMVTAFGIGGS